ncbi:MAG: hypothetical protein G01um1014106_690 [Parcubacteria group bacterium Gr01-1014_106]|nr:MAG: hypothetical protein G01um1014106_690 [Parcubacteria group bacterium Gr01-1014_106]
MARPANSRQTVTSVLIKARKAANRTMTDIARHFGISLAGYKSWEKRGKVPDNRITSLARFLRIPAKTLRLPDQLNHLPALVPEQSYDLLPLIGVILATKIKRLTLKQLSSLSEIERSIQARGGKKFRLSRVLVLELVKAGAI